MEQMAKKQQREDYVLGSVEFEGRVLTAEVKCDRWGAKSIVVTDLSEQEHFFLNAQKASMVHGDLRKLKNEFDLSLWQIHELFGFDGHSSGLAGHVLTVMMSY